MLGGAKLSAKYFIFSHKRCSKSDYFENHKKITIFLGNNDDDLAYKIPHKRAPWILPGRNRQLSNGKLVFEKSPFDISRLPEFTKILAGAQASLGKVHLPPKYHHVSKRARNQAIKMWNWIHLPSCWSVQSSLKFNYL